MPEGHFSLFRDEYCHTMFDLPHVRCSPKPSLYGFIAMLIRRRARERICSLSVYIVYNYWCHWESSSNGGGRRRCDFTRKVNRFRATCWLFGLKPSEKPFQIEVFVCIRFNFMEVTVRGKYIYNFTMLVQYSKYNWNIAPH